jgi:peptide/nickel transport system substrate-binding protein
MSALSVAEFGGGSADAAGRAGLGRRGFLLGAAGLSAGLVAGCSAGQPAALTARQPRPRYGGNLSVGLTGGSTSDTLDPHQPVTDIDIARVLSLYEPLVTLDIQAKDTQYLLAESITPRNSNLTEWVIRLRPGITFHDGKPLTSADVLFSFRRIVSNGFAGKTFLGPIDIAGTTADHRPDPGGRDC